jgi:molybdopterin-guanine dinucleotide biosynthesis protein A
MRHPASALILAGGQSSRMGTDKALLLVNDEPLIAHAAKALASVFDEVLISANQPEKYTFLSLPILQDPVPDTGPMAGVIAGLRTARHPRLAVVACDILTPDLTLLLELLACCPPKDTAPCTMCSAIPPQGSWK